MPVQINEMAREIERQEDLQDREYFENLEREKRKHELRVLDRKIKIRTRWNGYVNIVKHIMLVLPRCLAVIAIVIIVLFGKPVPKVLEDILS